MKLFLSAFAITLFSSSMVFAQVPLQPTRYVNYRGLSIAVYESTGTQKPAAILVHGNTSSANSYAQILSSSFAQNRKVIALDMPGYGRSSRANGVNGVPDTYTTGLLAEAVREVAQATGNDTGVLVGWSLGGDIALQATSIMPNLKGVFLFGTNPIGNAAAFPVPLGGPFLTPEESAMQNGNGGPAVNFGFVGALPQNLIDAYVTAFFADTFSPIPQFFFDDSVIDTDGSLNGTDPGTRDAVLTAALGGDPSFLDELQIVLNYNKPIAFVSGDKDSFLNLNYLSAVAQNTPNAYTGDSIIVPGAGHAIHWEQPAAFISILEGFINSL